MRTLHSYHATHGTPLCLQFDSDIETHQALTVQAYTGTALLQMQREAFRAEAEAVVEAMLQHLPGGLVDALFAALCARQASVLHVAHRQPLPHGGRSDA